jgi:hypothetical protein|tara:strand:+ start:2190 stop:3290 length:1101 start_codon:yes stop_codon:yes gene_type:complete
VGYPRYKKRDGDAYYHRRCPSEDLEDTAGTSGDERGRRGRASEEAETSDGYVTTPSVPPSSARRRRVMRRAGKGEAAAVEAAVAARRGETSTSGGGDAAAVAGARELSKIARWIDDVACGVKSVDVTSTWVRGALVASSGVYVAAAWLYVLPSSLRVVLDIGAFALQMITVSGILAGVFVATGLISREDAAAALRRLRETKRTAFASARAEALAVVAPRDRAGPFERDVDVASTPPRVTSNRFAEAPTVEFPETPRGGPSPSPSPAPAPRLGESELQRLLDDQRDRVQRLTDEKRDTESMLEEASETIEFLRDALQSVDEARASDKRRLVELERKLARDAHTVKTLAKRVRSKETDLAAAEPWMLE